MVTVRVADSDEDLTTIWPVLGLTVLNRDDVFVAEVDGHLIGGLLLWDSGHEIVYAGELVLHGEAALRRTAALRLLRAVTAECKSRGRRALMFHTVDDNLESMARKMGGITVQSGTQFMAIGLNDLERRLR
jgi:hypothetical protein